ncbi:hypothetical protein Ct9H90mP29_21880 [bacterium]|nr:MAG: hypothetical protein Ct9H90mP29_21880 [bacterium]
MELFNSKEKLPLAHFNSPPNFNFVGIFWQDGIAGSIGFLFLKPKGLIMRSWLQKMLMKGEGGSIQCPFNSSNICDSVSNAGWIGRAIARNAGILPAGLQPNDVFVAVTNIVASPGIWFYYCCSLCALM